MMINFFSWSLVRLSVALSVSFWAVFYSVCDRFWLLFLIHLKICSLTLSSPPQNLLLAPHPHPHPPFLKGDLHIRSMTCPVNEAASGQPYIHTAAGTKYVF